jgi:hypothetical protein
MKYTFVYVMGMLMKTKYTQYSPALKRYGHEIEMDLSFMRIRVRSIRIIQKQGLVFISSPHYSEGHIINVDFITSGWSFTIRRLEGINNEHLLDKNGVFSRQGLNKVYFHYFTGSDPKNPILSYSLNINFKRAYISLKSKTKDLGISKILISGNDGRNIEKSDSPKPIEIQVQS